MGDPVSLESGSTFERAAITEWLRTHRTDPLTNRVLASKRLVPNTAVRSLAQRFCEDNGGQAGERSWDSSADVTCPSPLTETADVTKPSPVHRTTSNIREPA